MIGDDFLDDQDIINDDDGSFIARPIITEYEAGLAPQRPGGARRGPHAAEVLGATEGATAVGGSHDGVGLEPAAKLSTNPFSPCELLSPLGGDPEPGPLPSLLLFAGVSLPPRPSSLPPESA